MENIYSSGIAFVFEGDTEKIFYYTMLSYFVSKHPGYSLDKRIDDTTGETFYVLLSETKSILIKTNVVGTVSQISNSGAWFLNRCYKENKNIGWTVFLCYDTDSYNNDITKIMDGDWIELRKLIENNENCTVIDLAAQADIEDIMLLDSDNIFKYIGIDPVPIPAGGKKGKRKMKKLFRMKGNGFAYHEGQRAEPLIQSLDFDKIISKSTIPFIEIENKCFN